MTSGNVAGEPIVTDDEDALVRLAGLADAWLTHDRPIHVPCDDSVVRVVDGEPLPVRRSRGYAPLPLHLPFPTEPVLAVGGDLKNTFCLAAGRQAWMSAHVGDMDDYRTQQAFDRRRAAPRDAHRHRARGAGRRRAPVYRSAAWARTHADGRPVHRRAAPPRPRRVHHGRQRAPRDRPVLGIAFDGTGYGDRRRGLGRRVPARRLRRRSSGGPPRLRRRCPAATPASATRAGWPSPTSTRPASRGRPGSRA